LPVSRGARSRVARGALVVDYDGRTEIHAGRSTLVVFGAPDARTVPRLLTRLRPLGGARERLLAPPAALRDVQRIVAVHAPTRSVERTHRSLRISRSAVRCRLRLTQEHAPRALSPTRSWSSESGR
jgi:hypothetical protein